MVKQRESEKPLHKNHPNGLGIKNFLCEKVTCARPWNWELVLKEFMVIVAGAKLTGKEGAIPNLYKRITQFEPDDEMCTHGAITIKQTMPMRGSIHEYFLEEGRIDLAMDRCTMSLDD